MIYPIFFVSMLTVFIGFIAVKVRIQSVRKGLVNTGYFKLMQGENLPESMIKTGRCYNNMFEIPCLFYAVCTLYIVLDVENLAGLWFAWAFVIFRFLQASVHLTTNKVKYRMYLYGGGVFCIVLLWVNLLIEHL